MRERWGRDTPKPLQTCAPYLICSNSAMLGSSTTKVGRICRSYFYIIWVIFYSQRCDIDIQTVLKWCDSSWAAGTNSNKTSRWCSLACSSSLFLCCLIFLTSLNYSSFLLQAPLCSFPVPFSSKCITLSQNSLFQCLSSVPSYVFLSVECSRLPDCLRAHFPSLPGWLL